MLNRYNQAIEPQKTMNPDCNHLKKSFDYVKIKKKGCIPKCQNTDIIFTKDQKEETQTLVIIFAFLCLGLSLVTMIVYIMNCCTGESHSAATFANRSPVFLAFSYVGLSLGYLISQFGIINNPGMFCHVLYRSQTIFQIILENK